MPIMSDNNPPNMISDKKKSSLISEGFFPSAMGENKVWEISVHEINPKRCKPWKYHNRDIAWLTPERCKDLIHSIQKYGQNEPALVREIKNDPDYDFELIYGVRRWFSCSVIPNQKLRVKVTDADDKTCMILMHSENACSKDISEFERAFSFAQQMKSGVFRNQTEMAEAMGITQGTISKMIRSAEIIEHPWIDVLFQHKLDIPVKYAYALSSLLKNSETLDLIKKEAFIIRQEIEAHGQYQSATNILKRLIGCAVKGNKNSLSSIILISGDKPVIFCHRDKLGKFYITIEDEVKSLNRTEVEAACLKAIREHVYGNRDKIFPGE